jgi:hypothetical protein
MKRRFLGTLGFGIGLGSASLLAPNFFNVPVSSAYRPGVSVLNAPPQAVLTPGAIAQQVSYGITPQPPATPLAIGDRPNRCLQNVGLLQRVPNFTQHLDWYGITQAGAIANAPKPEAPKPVITQWNRIQAEILSPTDPCGNHSPNTAQRHPSPLQQQAHFILSLASLTQKNDWLLQPQPQLPQPVHTVWRNQEPMEMKLASQFQ